MDFVDILGSKARIKILHLLSKRDMYVSEIMEKAGLDGKNAKHHLTVLEENRVVSTEKKGRKIFYSLEKEISIQISPSPGRRFEIQFQDVDID